MGIEAVQLFNQLSNEILGDWIYVCVLNACSHSGLVHQAKKIFEKIPINERTNQIYTTMVKRKNFSHLNLI
jgi:pentatricopeptide repeat protein